MVQESMLFQEGVELRGKYSFPFSIDRKANSEAFGFVDIVSQYRGIFKYRAEILISGNRYYVGQLVVLDWSESYFNVAITRETEEMDTNQYLDEIIEADYGNIGQFANRNADRAKVYPEIDYGWPQVYNYNEETLKVYGTSAYGQDFIIQNWNNGNSQAADGTEVAVPMFYLLSVFDKLFPKLGLQVQSSFYASNYIRKLAVYNPISIIPNVTNCLKLEAVTYSPGIGIVRMFSTPPCFTVPVGSVIHMSVFEWNYTDGQVNVFGVSHIVSSADIVSIAAFMTALRTTFVSVTGAILVSENYVTGHPTFQVKFTSGNEMLIKAPSVTQPDFTSRIDRGWWPLMVIFNDVYSYQTNIQMQKHLPHISVSSFLDACRGYYNLSITLDEANGKVLIEHRRDIITQANKPTYTPLVMNEGTSGVAPNYRITLNHDSDNDLKTEGWPVSADNYPESSVLPVTEIMVEAGTVMTANMRNSNSGFGTMPIIDHELGTYDEKPAFGLRFLVIEGYTPDTAGQSYVKSTNQGLTPNEVYTDYYQAWYELVKRMEKAPVYYFDFGMDTLRNMRPGIWKVDKNDFIWKRISTVIHNTQGVGISKVEGYKL
jgi:hypothetical protein